MGQVAATNTTDRSSDLSFGDIFRLLRRRIFLIIACTVVGTALALAYALTATPIYEATASLRIDPARADSLGLGDLLSAGGESSELIATETSILQSDAVIIGTLNSLPDDVYKRYTGFNKEATVFPSKLASLAEQQKELGGKAESLSNQQENILKAFHPSLAVKQTEGTQILVITFRDKDPDVAATIVNHLIYSYLRDSYDSRTTSVVQVQSWLNDAMVQLKNKAVTAQEALASFQERNNIIGTDASNNTVMDRLKILNGSLAQAQADRIAKEAQLRAALTGDPAVLSALAPASDLQSLETDRANLFAQYAQLSAKFGQNYPPLQQNILQRQKLDQEIDRLTSSVRNRMQQDYNASKAIQDNLQKQYDAQTELAFSINRQAAQYAVLVAESTSSRDLYDTLQYKLQQAGVDAGLNAINTMLVDSARTPKVPVEPKKLLILSFGLILGLVAGIGSVFLVDSVSDVIKHISQIEERVGYPVLASIPHMNLQDAKSNRGITLIAASEPQSRVAEAYRSLRNSILLSYLDHPPKTLLISSCLPGDGKSNTSANYSVVLAQRNARVLLVDTDLRRPALHRLFGVENTDGLTDYLMGDVEQPKFLTPITELPNLQLLTAGKGLPFPSELLGSDKFRELIRSLEADYDHIVLDSAPLLVVSDTLPVTTWAAALVLVVRFEKTHLNTLKRLRDILARTNANVAGVVLNDVSDIGEEYGYYGNAAKGYYNYTDDTRS